MLCSLHACLGHVHVHYGILFVRLILECGFTLECGLMLLYAHYAGLCCQVSIRACVQQYAASDATAQELCPSLINQCIHALAFRFML